jgi:D-alanyl-D-alanine carboxypeptidase/D-alanyl-D-alanine-endopeptidase (penicillin-binding protein 4)
MKLFTVSAALYYLGPDYRYNTFLLATGPVQDGSVLGDLVIYGTGDPTLSDRFSMKTSVWEAFADTLAASGVREVRGSIVGDASYFDGPGSGEGWQPEYINASYAAPASALSYAENIATLQIRPGTQVGWRPEVRLVPGGEGIAIVNEATTVPSGATRINVARAAYDGPVLITGQIALKAGSILRAVPIGDPGRYAGAALREALTKRGITVSGGVTSVRHVSESPVTGRSVFAPAFDSTEPLRVLAVHTSPRLIDILEVINKKSHNLLAEQTLRTIGRVSVGEGTVAAGAHAVRHLLTEATADTLQLRQFDGSGLSVLNRVNAWTVVDLLAYMAGSPMWDSFWYTLPEAGARDGLHRMYKTPADGNLRAKTGTINRVSALSGYVKAANGERLAFSIISNNVPSTWRAKRIEDGIGARLAAFDRPSVPANEEPATDAPAEPVPSTAAEAPAPADTPAVPAAKAATYTIKSGDTLDGIARRLGMTVADLMAANPRLDPRRLLVGTKIRIR